MSSRTDRIWQHVDEAFDRADEAFKRADRTIKEAEKFAEEKFAEEKHVVLQPGVHHLRFGASGFKKRLRLAGKFVGMAFIALTKGSVTFKFKSK